MNTSDVLIDVFLPTARKRLWNAVYQVHAVFSNPYPIRLTIALSEAWPEFEAKLTQYEGRIRWTYGDADGKMNDTTFVSGGYGCGAKWLACFERLDWATWFYLIPDDDCTLPWAFDHFVPALDEQHGMIIAQALAVSRKEHLDFTPYTLGRQIKRCRIGMNNVILNMRKLETLDGPWLEIENAYNDWLLIERMAQNFTYKIINSAVAVQALCEANQLPPDYLKLIENHNKIEANKEPSCANKK